MSPVRPDESEPCLPGTGRYERLVVELRAGRLNVAAFVAIIDASVEGFEAPSRRDS